MTLRFCGCIITGMLTTLALSGCILVHDKIEENHEFSFQQEMQKPVTGAVSIHTLIRFSENKSNEISVPSFYYDHVLVDSTPWLTSMDIEDIQPVERPVAVAGIYDLKLILTEAGRRKWEKMFADDPKDGYVFLVDGTLYQTFHPRKIYASDKNEVIVDGPFDNVISLQLRKQAPLNYLKLNRKTGKLVNPADAQKKNQPDPARK